MATKAVVHQHRRNVFRKQNGLTPRRRHDFELRLVGLFIGRQNRRSHDKNRHNRCRKKPMRSQRSSHIRQCRERRTTAEPGCDYILSEEAAFMERASGIASRQRSSAMLPRLARLVMPLCHFSRTPQETTGWFVAILHREPFRIPFPIDGPRIATVQQMAEFVNQNVIQIKISQRLLGPDKFPRCGAILFPTAAVHFRFNALGGLRRRLESFNQAFLDRIQINRRSPLHAIARKTEFLPGHAAKLHDLQRLNKLAWQLGQTAANVVRRKHVPVSRPGLCTMIR